MAGLYEWAHCCICDERMRGRRLLASAHSCIFKINRSSRVLCGGRGQRVLHEINIIISSSRLSSFVCVINGAFNALRWRATHSYLQLKLFRRAATCMCAYHLAPKLREKINNTHVNVISIISPLKLFGGVIYQCERMSCHLASRSHNLLGNDA